MTRTDKIFKSLITVLAIAGLIIGVYNKITWKDSIRNPANDEFVAEIAFNRQIEKSEVKQWMFRERYLKDK